MWCPPTHDADSAHARACFGAVLCPWLLLAAALVVPLLGAWAPPPWRSRCRRLSPRGCGGGLWRSRLGLLLCCWPGARSALPFPLCAHRGQLPGGGRGARRRSMRREAHRWGVLGVLGLAVPLVRPPGLTHWWPALVCSPMQWGSGCGARSRPRPLRPVLGLWLAGFGPLRCGGCGPCSSSGLLPGGNCCRVTARSSDLLDLLLNSLYYTIITYDFCVIRRI